MKTPDHQAAWPNVPFNSSSASVFSFFLLFFFASPHSVPHLHQTDYVSLSLPPAPFLFFFIRYVSVRERSAAAGHRKYISVEKVKRPPYVRHYSGWTDGRTDGRTNGRVVRVGNRSRGGNFACIEKKTGDKERWKERDRERERERERERGRDT